MWFKANLLRSSVLDHEGRAVGTVESTRPSDGSDPEFAVVRLGSMTRVLVPVDGVRVIGKVAQFPYTVDEMSAAPGPDLARFEEDSLLDARAYWGMHRPEFHALAMELVLEPR